MIPIAGLIFGVAAAWLFRRLTNTGAVRAAANRIVAHLLELRLFLDEPAIVIEAQRNLVRENLRLLRLVALPACLITAVFVLIFPAMDRGPLRAGQTVVAAAPLGSPLRVPEGVTIETPGVRIPRLHETVWRVRLTREIRAGLDAKYPRAQIAGLPWVVWFSTFAICGAVLFALL